jgi:hypothetical protein
MNADIHHSTGFAYIISLIFFILAILLFYGSFFATTGDAFFAGLAFFIVAVLSYVWVSKFFIITKKDYFIYKTLTSQFKIFYSEINEVKHLVGVPSSKPTEMRGFFRLKIIHGKGNFTINEAMFADSVLCGFINKIMVKNKKVRLNSGAQKIFNKEFNSLRKDYLVPFVKVLFVIAIVQAAITVIIRLLI